MFVANEIEIFKNLADETRLGIVKFLLDGEKCVCEIFPVVGRTQSTVSIHLSKLEKAGIVSSRRDGKKMRYRISDERIFDIMKLFGKTAKSRKKGKK